MRRIRLMPFCAVCAFRCQPGRGELRIPDKPYLFCSPEPHCHMDHTASQLCALQMPDTMPVMVLDDCYLFPGCFLPLFIFEERYRQMLSSALDTSRMFCIGCRSAKDGEDLLPISTAGMVRACRKQDDGTSHVMLYGVSRIRFTGWAQQKPFRVANIEPLITSFSSPVDELNEMKAKALRLLPKPTAACGEAMQVLRTTLQQMKCPEMVCDILTYHFVRQPVLQRQLLMEPVLERRFACLLGELERLASEPEGSKSH